MSPGYRYTLDPVDDTAPLVTSGCTKLHLVVDALDPRTKTMADARRHVRGKAFRYVEYLGA